MKQTNQPAETGFPRAANLAALITQSVKDPIVLTRAIDLHANANDASHFLMTPQAVVIARDSGEIAKLLAASSAQGVPLTFRSGGTSLSGQGVTGGVLVDVRRNFRGVQVLDEGNRVQVQPGSTIRQVNARLARFGRKLGPDPASEIACTIGGVVANNSSGMVCGTSTNAYRTLESMVVVLASGTIIDTGAADADEALRRAEPDLYAGLLSLRDRIRSNTESVSILSHQFSMKNTMGYGLNSFLDHDSPVEILAHLMVGSEGTLGFVAEVIFRTVPQFSYAATGLLLFDTLHAANDALPALVGSGASAIELMDSIALRVSQREPGCDPYIQRLSIDKHAALLVEYQAETPQKLELAVAGGHREIAKLQLSVPGQLTTDADRRANLWRLRKGLYASVAEARPPGTTALLEDIVVPVQSLARACSELTDLFQRYEYEDSVIFGHAKDGNIHFMLTDRFSDDAALKRYSAFTEDMVDLVLNHGGSLKAEHGTGRVMAPFVRRQYGDELYSVMKEVKRLFDPESVLNPGVLLSEDANAHLRNFKTSSPIEEEADKCVECGYCEPVCPSRDLTLTPRQRIVVRRAMKKAEEEGDSVLVDDLERDYDYGGLQTCAVDGMCQTACPVGINTGDLVKRLRKADHSAAETSIWKSAAKHWAGATLAASTALTLAKSVPAPLVVSPNKMARTLLGSESVPLWSTDLPRGGRSRLRSVPTGVPSAVYMPACVNTMFGAPDGARGVQDSLQLLSERAGITLHIPDNIDSLCCGTPWSSKGLPAGGAIMRQRLLGSLRKATGNGELPIICDASSCTEGIVQLISEDTVEPRLRVIDAVEFVATNILPAMPEHRKLESVTIHPTCSSTRLGTNAALRQIASAVATSVFIPDDWGCCAFAGDRGMLHPELTESATRIQAAQIKEADSSAHASCNRTCELGMTRATGHSYQHILELLEEVTRP